MQLTSEQGLGHLQRPQGPVGLFNEGDPHLLPKRDEPGWENAGCHDIPKMPKMFVAEL